MYDCNTVNRATELDKEIYKNRHWEADLEHQKQRVHIVCKLASTRTTEIIILHKTTVQMSKNNAWAMRLTKTCLNERIKDVGIQFASKAGPHMTMKSATQMTPAHN